MATFKTYADVMKLPAPSGEVTEKGDPKQGIHWDMISSGLGVVCSATSTTRTFVAQATLGRTRKKRRVTIARVDDWRRAGKTLDEARAEAAKVRVELAAGRDPKAPEPVAPTLRDALGDYLAKHPNLAESTRTGYREDVETRFARWLDKPLRDISPEDVETRFHAIRVEAAGRADNDLFVSKAGGAAANSALRALRAVWRFAHGGAPDLVPAWPTARLRKQWYAVGRRRRSVKLADLPAFIAAVNARNEAGDYALGRDMRDLILLFLFTGFRRKEACELRWSYVDFEAGVIRLPPAATKTKVEVDLPMSDLVRDLLVARRALGIESDFVFTGRRGRNRIADAPVSEPKKAFEALGKTLGFRVSPHDLRRTFITVVDNTGGITPLAARALVEHAIDVGDVHSGYVQEVELRKAAQLVARALKRRCGITPPRGANVRVLKRKRARR
jgi:integrase